MNLGIPSPNQLIADSNKNDIHREKEFDIFHLATVAAANEQLLTDEHTAT